MQKKSWLLIAILVFCFFLTLVVLFWRQQKIQEKYDSLSHFAPPDTSEPTPIPNQFPIIPSVGQGELLTYWLECQIEEINQYRNYPQAPLIPGGWKVLAEISCSYIDKQGSLQIIHLPLHIYHPVKQDYLLVGTDIQKETDENKIRQIAEITSLAWYEKMTETFWGSSIAIGKTIKIDLDFPSAELAMEKTRGAAFETLLEPNPPYTKEALLNFYQSGDPQFLPRIDGKSYFWPVVRYLLK